MAFSLDNRWFAAAVRNDKMIRLWALPDWGELARVFHDDMVLRVAFSPDSHWLATSSADNTARLWEVPTDREHVRLDHEDDVNSVKFSPDGNLLATASDKTVSLWEVPTDREHLRLSHDGYVTSVVFSPDGDLLATGGEGGMARLWEMPNGRERVRLQDKEYVHVVTFSPDGNLLITRSSNGIARGWGTADGREYFRIFLDDTVNVLKLSPDGRLLAAAGTDNATRLYHVPIQDAEVRILQPYARLLHEDWIDDISFSPNSRLLATACYDGTAQLWELRTGRERISLPHAARVHGAKFSPDGRWLVTKSNLMKGSSSSTIRIWSMELIVEMAGSELDSSQPVTESTPPNRRQLRIFLCHSSADKLAVRQLCERLRADGFQPWLDDEEILPGQDWDFEIRKAIRQCDLILVCLSKGAISKVGYVQKEIRNALDIADEQPEGSMFIIPVRLEVCDVPARLVRWQWVDLFRNDGYSRLIRALQRQASLPG